MPVFVDAAIEELGMVDGEAVDCAAAEVVGDGDADAPEANVDDEDTDVVVLDVELLGVVRELVWDVALLVDDVSPKTELTIDSACERSELKFICAATGVIRKAPRVSLNVFILLKLLSMDWF